MSTGKKTFWSLANVELFLVVLITGTLAFRLFSASSSPDRSPDTSFEGWVRGTVVAEQSQRPIAGATVVRTLAGSTFYSGRDSTSTGPNGRFQVSVRDAGTHVLEVRHPKYQTARDTVRLQEVGSTEVSIALSRPERPSK